ncbi:MADS-box transcription factor PHERES 1 [Linum perenne]
MRGKKVTFARIANETSRRQTMTRRQKGLVKKVKELTTLCGVSALCIMYKSTVDEPAEPLVWPSDDGQVQELCQLYSIPEIQRHMHMTDQEEYLKKMIAKTQERHMKLMKKNNNMETALLMDKVQFGKGIEIMDIQEIYNMEWLLKEKINALRKKQEYVEPLPPGPFDYYENVAVTPEARPQ